MKVALVLLVICAAFVSANSLPTTEETPGTKAPMQWFNPLAYEYMMCRIQCKQSCAEQGYWRGYCKDGECLCYGTIPATLPRMKEVALPMY